jgi:hypothetical protein
MLNHVTKLLDADSKLDEIKSLIELYLINVQHSKSFQYQLNCSIDVCNLNFEFYKKLSEMNFTKGLQMTDIFNWKAAENLKEDIVNQIKYNIELQSDTMLASSDSPLNILIGSLKKANSRKDSLIAVKQFIDSISSSLTEEQLANLQKIEPLKIDGTIMFCN